MAPSYAASRATVTSVAKPTKEGGCSAEVWVNAGRRWWPLANCGNPARKGFLTCVRHEDREVAARKLQAENSIST